MTSVKKTLAKLLLDAATANQRKHKVNVESVGTRQQQQQQRKKIVFICLMMLNVQISPAAEEFSESS